MLLPPGGPKASRRSLYALGTALQVLLESAQRSGGRFAAILQNHTEFHLVSVGCDYRSLIDFRFPALFRAINERPIRPDGEDTDSRSRSSE